MPERSFLTAVATTVLVGVATFSAVAPASAAPVLDPNAVVVGNLSVDVVLSPDGTKGYSANYGDNTVTVFTPATGATVATIAIPWEANSLALSPDGSRLLVASSSLPVVATVDALTNTGTGGFGTTWSPGRVVISSGAVAYVPTTGSTYQRVTLTSFSLTTHPLSGSGFGAALSPDGSRLYVSTGSPSYGLDVIDTATDVILRTVTLGGQPSQVAVSPDGGKILVADSQLSRVSVVDAATDAVTRIPTGISPKRVTISPVGTTAYATTNFQSAISVIDYAAGTETDTISTPGFPFAIDVTADGATGYVAFGGLNRVGRITGLPAAAVPPPGTVPGAATLSGAAGDGRITLSFAKPSDSGGVITRYEYTTDGGTTWHDLDITPGTPLTASITGLTNGTEVNVQIRARNARGAGPVSNVVTLTPAAGDVTPPPALPPIVRSKLIPVPADPTKYTGPKAATKAYLATYAGTDAHPAADVAGIDLTPGQAANLVGSKLFGKGNALLTTAGKRQAQALAASLKAEAKAVTCEGFSDYSGTAGKQTKLSAARAAAICTVLRTSGVEASVKAVGYGGKHPAVVGGTPNSRSQNVRVVVAVTG